MFPSPSKSHLIVVQTLATTLAQKGHVVTVASPFPLSKPIKNYRDIKTPLPDKDEELKSMMMTNSMHTGMPFTMEIVKEMSDKTFYLPEFQKMMTEEKFDLIIVKCPTVFLSVAGSFTFTNLII